MAKLKVCLTGGIASGKTHVSDAFQALGACVIDADVVAREVVAKDTVGLARLVAAFGKDVLHQDGALNRKALKSRVFNDPEQLTLLNSILHPLIRQAMWQQAEQNSLPVEVYVIPLYDGGPASGQFDRVLVVDVSESIQMSRVMSRDQIDTKLARSILASQLNRPQRLALASDVLVNNKSLAELDQDIPKVYDFYAKLSADENTIK